MVLCSAFGCKSRSENKEVGITFHRFPRHVERRKSWIRNMRLADWEPTARSRLCSKHFERHLFFIRGTTTCLLKEAVPTLFPELPKYMQPEKLRNMETEGTANSVPSTSTEPVSSVDIKKYSAEEESLREMLVNLTAKSKSKSKTIRVIGQRIKRHKKRIVALKKAIKDLETEALVVCTEQVPVKVDIRNE
ncbi:hypothetical protein NQ315_015260 [Exocentrus adspersus]|uniref:THAP-type domain-containing protein n=1 Tax=Exocentrus adspersus TaxID=1586481 RepID=A0AAV8VAT5_9CUCU|nr:hypothetical protein NQ315_015260 [Exocentrus adspersus]